MDYHHIQPRTIPPYRPSPGDLALMEMRERRRSPPAWKSLRPARRPCTCTVVNICLDLEPQPRPEPVTVPTPYGPVVVDPSPRSPLEEILSLTPIVAISQAMARPRVAGGLQHMIRCWMNNLLGGCR